MSRKPMKRLLESLTKIDALPHTKRTLDWISPNTYLPRELEVKKDEKGLGLYSMDKIKAGVDVFLVPASYCITNFDMYGMTKQEESQFKSGLEKNAAKSLLKYTANTKSIVNLMVGIAQIAAGITETSLHHHIYSTSIIQTPLHDLPSFYSKQEIECLSGSFAFPKFKSQISTIDKVYTEFVANTLPGIDKPTFVQLFNYLRSRFINVSPNEEFESQYDPLVSCPLMDILNHDNHPNCIVNPFFDRILDESVFGLKTLREIKQGEELTISYGNWGIIRS